MNEIKIDYDLSNFNEFMNVSTSLLHLSFTKCVKIDGEFYYERGDFDIEGLRELRKELSLSELNILENKSIQEIEKRYNNINTDKISFIDYVKRKIENSINELNYLADEYDLYDFETKNIRDKANLSKLPLIELFAFIKILRQFYEGLKSRIETELLITQKSKDKKEIINKTFESKLTTEQIEKLYTALKGSNYIPSTTSLEAFRMIFNGEPIENIEEPLKWLKTNRDLAYLFNKLFSNELIKNKNFASVIEYYNFINSNNKKLTAGDIRTALSDIKRNGTSKELDNIDKIINKVLSDKIQIKQTKE